MNIKINLNKAKEITKDRLRRERQPLLQKLDIQFQQALEKQLDTSPIVTEKQRLRDITKIVENVNTPEELKNISCT